MTADEFRAALGVLDKGRPAHNIYEVEDAAAAIGPVRRAYWRIFMAVAICAFPPFYALLALAHAPTMAAKAAAMMSPGWLLSVRAFRDRCMPVRGLRSDEILRAAIK